MRVPTATVKLKANIMMTKAIPAMKEATTIPIRFLYPSSEHGEQGELPKEIPRFDPQTEPINISYVVLLFINTLSVKFSAVV